jgi:hypothetical protein
MAPWHGGRARNERQPFALRGRPGEPDEGCRPICGYLADLPVGLLIVAPAPWFSTGFLDK